MIESDIGRDRDIERIRLAGLDVDGRSEQLGAEVALYIAFVGGIDVQVPVDLRKPDGGMGVDCAEAVVA